MRASIRIALLSLALTVGLVTASPADYRAGKEAYRAKNYAAALREFLPLVEQAHPNAMSYLGLMYEFGQGVIKDHAKAVELHRRAAIGGVALSQFRLGRLFMKGLGIAFNPDMAIMWYREAAAQGHANSQYELGRENYFGGRLPLDQHKALDWFAKGAAQDHARSQYMVGRIYETGGPVRQDSMMAIEWYRKAAAHGVKKAADKLKMLLAIHGPISPKSATAPVVQPKKIVVTSVAKPNDIAVVIGNGDYGKFGKDIPNVVPAHADADAFRKWLIDSKGLREGNVIFLKDATSAQIESVFGNERSHKGQLFNWTKANKSNIYVYYAGHGAPASDGGSAFLVPADATASSIELTGYPLASLYENLKKIPAKSITLVLESCFSGASQGGYVINRTSGILVTAKIPRAPRNITIISAGKADQVASWEKDDSHSLFTKYFLLGMGGEADKSPHGNGDGKVAYAELGKYLDGTMTYYARRYYGRDQHAQIVTTTQ